MGIRKYGTTLDQNTLDDYLQQAYEEALDLAQYLKTEILRRQKLRDIVNNSSDEEIPEKLREYVK